MASSTPHPLPWSVFRDKWTCLTRVPPDLLPCFFTIHLPGEKWDQRVSIRRNMIEMSACGRAKLILNLVLNHVYIFEKNCVLGCAQCANRQTSPKGLRRTRLTTVSACWPRHGDGKGVQQWRGSSSVGVIGNLDNMSQPQPYVLPWSSYLAHVLTTSRPGRPHFNRRFI